MQPSVEQPIITHSRNASPLEELLLRLQSVLPPLKLSDAEHAALLLETRTERIEHDGAIRFEIAGRMHEYYSPESPTCRNLKPGTKVHLAVSRTFTAIVHVIQADKKYLDTIPLREALRWFDYEKLSHEIREQETVLKAASKELERLHGGDIQKRHYANRGNIERVEGWREAKIINTFPAPSETLSGAASLDRPSESEASPETTETEQGGPSRVHLPTSPVRSHELTTDALCASTRLSETPHGPGTDGAAPSSHPAPRLDFTSDAPRRTLNLEPRTLNAASAMAAAGNRCRRQQIETESADAARLERQRRRAAKAAERLEALNY